MSLLYFFPLHQSRTRFSSALIDIFQHSACVACGPMAGGRRTPGKRVRDGWTNIARRLLSFPTTIFTYLPTCLVPTYIYVRRGAREMSRSRRKARHISRVAYPFPALSSTRNPFHFFFCPLCELPFSIISLNSGRPAIYSNIYIDNRYETYNIMFCRAFESKKALSIWKKMWKMNRIGRPSERVGSVCLRVF